MINWILFILYALATLLYLITRFYTTLHMFQQNRYERPRFKLWMKTNYIIDYMDIQMLFISFVFVIIYYTFPQIFTALFAFTLLILWFLVIDFRYYQKSQHQIIALNMTPRVKRLIGTLSLLGLVMLAIASFYPVVLFILPVLGYLSGYVMQVVAAINEPLENNIKTGYKKDAQKKLLSHTRLKKIGITGSFGKTSSKNILNEILSEAYYTLMTPASFNTPMGITRTINQDLKATHEIFICEMGADKVGEITELMDFVQPQYGILTSIGPQHLTTFLSIDNIIKEKFEVIERLPKDGVGVLNMDEPYIANYHIKQDVMCLTYAIMADAQYRASNIRYTTEGTQFNLHIKGDETVYAFKTRLLGVHNVYNILAAIALGHHLGITLPQLQVAVQKVNYIPHRLELKHQQDMIVLDDAFNANPVGSKNALEVLGQMGAHRMIMTPGMIDLGDKQDEYNYLFGTYMIHHVDEVILVGRIQTQAIVSGLKDSGFDMTHVYVVDKVAEGFEQAQRLKQKGSVLLIENDLPDAFSH